MPELKVKFTGDTAGYDAAVARIRKRNATLQADIEKTVKAERAGNASYIAEHAKRRAVWHEESRKAADAPGGQTSRQRRIQTEIESEVKAERTKNRAIIVEQQRLIKTRRDEFDKNLAGYTGRKGGRAAELDAEIQRTFQTTPGGMSGRPGGRFGAAPTMFISALRDSFTSLASGMNPLTILAQQAPQVIQGFTMMGKEALKASLRFIGIGAAAVAAGLGIYALMRHFQNLRDAAKNAADMTDFSTRSITNQARALQEAAKAHQEQEAWLRSHARAQMGLADAAEIALNSLRKKHQFERQAAQDRGASPRQMARLELNQAREELELVQRERDAALDRHTRGLREQQEAAAAVQRFSASDNAQQIAAAKEKADENIKIAEAIRKKMSTQLITEVDVDKSRQAGGPVYNVRGATDRDKMDVEVGGKNYKMSLAEARSAINAATSEAALLGNTERGLETALKEKTEQVEKDNKQYQDLKQKGAGLEEDVRLMEQFGGRRRNGGGSGGRLLANPNELQRINLMAAGNTPLLDVNRSMDRRLSQIVTLLGRRGGRGVNFGGGSR